MSDVDVTTLRPSAVVSGLPAGADGRSSAERAALHRLRWYMHLRWAGVAVIYAATVTAHQIGHYNYSLTTGNVIAPVVIVYNVAIWRAVSRWWRRPPVRWQLSYRLLGNAQCSADLLLLAIGLHLAGGVENPGMIFPVAVLVVAGLVLSPLDSVLQGIFVCAVVDGIVAAEATGHLGHEYLGFLRPELVTDGAYVTAFLVVWDTAVLFVLALVVFLATRLRRREAALAELYDRERDTVRRLEEVDPPKAHL